MFRSTLFFLTAMLIAAGIAEAKGITYTIDPGTVGVIASKSDKVRLVIQAGNNCRETAYSVIADGVLAISGKFDLSATASMPLDYTVVTLSCSGKGVVATVEQPASGLGF